MYASVIPTISSFHHQDDLHLLRCPFISYNSNDISLQNHLDDFHLGQLPPATTLNAGVLTPESNSSTITLSEMVNKFSAEDDEYNGGHVNRVRVKKDKHSKIVTAQGLRDRRVRLSIGIARKFFNLQDILGFDKASKTVEWLFKKSQRAINEILLSSSSQTTNLCPNEGCRKSLSLTNLECEVARFNEANSVHGDSEMTTSVAKSCSSPSLDKKTKRPTTRRAPIQCLAKEKRKMARERARARTKEKLCNKKKFDEPKKYSEGTNSTNYVTSSLKMVCNEIEEPIISRPKVNQLPSREDLNGKLTRSSIFNYPPKHLTSKDICSNYAHLPSLCENWDISGVVTQSSFSTAEMNLSTEIQVYGKQWAAFNNHQSP